MMHVAAARPQRLVEYFVQVGLQHPLTPLLKDADRPITGVCLVYDREDAPDGFEKLEFTVAGGSGNLSSGGNVFSPAVWLCVSRAPNELGPITDLGILYIGREDGGKLAPGYTLLEADLNKGSYGYNIGLAYTRARLPGSHTGPILDIGIVNVARHDALPPRYRAIGGPRRNVNAGSFRDEIYLVAKYAIRDPLQVKYKPAVLDRFPVAEISGSPLPSSIALFCCPDGIELVPSAHGPPPATYASTVLTTDQSVEIYCACLTFYEAYHGDLPRVDDDAEDEKPSARPTAASAAAALLSPVSPAMTARPRGFSSAASFSDLANDSTQLYAPRKLCLVSFWPFYQNFCQYLEELYRHSRTTTRIPIERLILQLWETPLPSSGRMRVQLEMGSMAHSGSGGGGRMIVFDRPMPDDFPLANFPLTLLFRTLSLPNIMILLSAVLQEKKVIMASKVLPLLTYVGEAIRTLIFPLKWMHPYIPILPAPLAGMLDAPMPIFVGMAESFIDARVLTGDDLVVVYLDRDEIKLGGNGKEAYSTNSAAHVAANALAAATSSVNASPQLSAVQPPSASSSSSSSTPATASSVPDKLPHLTLLPRKLLQRLVHELRTHTNVTRLKRFASHKDLESYFHCFRSTSAAEELDEEEPNDEPFSRSRSSSDAPGGHQNSSASNLLAIRACFMHVFVSLLGGMDAFLRFPSFEKGATHTPAQLFDMRSFIERSDSKARPFLRVLADTQMFNFYIEEKTDCTSSSRAMELAFFAHAQKYELELEASIEAVKKMGMAQSAPALGVVLYLSQMGSNYTTYLVPPPDASGLVDTIYSYAAFPRRLDSALLRKPTPPPTPPPAERSPSPIGVNIAESSDSPTPPPPMIVRSVSLGAENEGVLYAPAHNVKSASSGGGGEGGPALPAAATMVRHHVKSLSNGSSQPGPPRPNPSASGMLPRGSSNPPPSRSYQPQPQPQVMQGSAPGTRMFVGARGPTAASFRPAPAQPPPPPEKKDTLSSIIDFLTAVRKPAPQPPPSPRRSMQQQPGQRTAPSTPQRYGPPPPGQRVAPNSAQRPIDPHRRISAPPCTGPRPGGPPPQQMAYSTTTTGTGGPILVGLAPQAQRATSMPRGATEPVDTALRTLNFDSAIGYQAPPSHYQRRMGGEDHQRRASFDASSSASYRPRPRPPAPQSQFSDNIHIEPPIASPERRTDISQTVPYGTTSAAWYSQR